MDELLKQIKNGLDNNLYYLALFVSLSVPDMCASLESDDCRTNRTKYKAWVDEYMVKVRPDKYGERLSSNHIYQFRCALLHQGRTKHDDSEYQRILFFEPGAQNSIVGPHCCVVGAETSDASLMIDIQQFCDDIVKGA